MILTLFSRYVGVVRFFDYKLDTCAFGKKFASIDFVETVVDNLHRVKDMSC